MHAFSVYLVCCSRTQTVASTGDPRADHAAEGHPHPDPNIDTNHDPLEPGGVLPNMAYQRWYPTSVLLPNGMVLTLSGTDRIDGDRRNTVQTTTPELYDPHTQTVIALENARKALPGEYPLAYVVQTGPGEDDWKVAVIGEHEDPPPSVMDAQIPSPRGTDGQLRQRKWESSGRVADRTDLNVRVLRHSTGRQSPARIGPSHSIDQTMRLDTIAGTR